MSNKLGAAYYDTDTKIVYLMQDVLEDGQFKTLKQCKYHHEPEYATYIVLDMQRMNSNFLL